jgi:hypothetical protein
MCRCACGGWSTQSYDFLYPKKGIKRVHSLRVGSDPFSRSKKLRDGVDQYMHKLYGACFLNIFVLYTLPIVAER